MTKRDYEHEATLFYRYGDDYLTAKKNLETRVKHKSDFENKDAREILLEMFPDFGRTIKKDFPD